MGRFGATKATSACIPADLRAVVGAGGTRAPQRRPRDHRWGGARGAGLAGAWWETSAVAEVDQRSERIGGGWAPDWPSVLRGATAGLAVLVPVTILRVVLERSVTDFDHRAWIYPLSVL